MPRKPKLKYKKLEDGTIEKRGHVITFTVKDVEEHIVQLEKLQGELSAQKSLDAAVMDNIKRNHETVVELDDDTLHACKMYFETKSRTEQIEDKLAEVEEQLAEYADELKEIEKQTNE